MARRFFGQRTVRRLSILVLLGFGALAYSEIRDYRSTPRADAATIELGRELFTHRWVPNDPLASGDGLGPVFNETSCAGCHSQPAVGGAGPVEKNAVLFDVRKLVTVQRPVVIPCSTETHVAVQVPMASSLKHGVVHSQATTPEYQETCDALRQAFEYEPAHGLEISSRNSIALFGIGLIDLIPDSAILHQAGAGGVLTAVSDLASGMKTQGEKGTGSGGLSSIFEKDVHGRARRLPGGRVGRFGWRGDFATVQEFTEAACANELGLSNPGHNQPAPLVKPDYEAPALDLTRKQCEAIAAFLRSLPRPVEELPTDPAEREAAENGKQLFTTIGCANCHMPKLGPVAGIYSDLLLHDMADPKFGPYHASLKPEPDPSELVSRPSESEWRTPPLWGVADSAPYMHDGSAPTLEAAIRAHHGQGRVSAQKFQRLDDRERAELFAFLTTLRAPVEARRQPATVSAATR